MRVLVRGKVAHVITDVVAFAERGDELRWSVGLAGSIFEAGERRVEA